MPTSYKRAIDAKEDKCPPTPPAVFLAASTIAIAFQRIQPSKIASRFKSPGYSGCWSTEIVLQYGVTNCLTPLTKPCLSASSNNRCKIYWARSLPSCLITEASDCNHSLVSAGSLSLHIFVIFFVPVGLILRLSLLEYDKNP